MAETRKATVLEFPKQKRAVPEVDLFLAPQHAMKLGRMAHERGVTPTHLVNEWVHEGLRRG